MRGPGPGKEKAIWRSSLVEKVSELVGEVWGDGGRAAHVPSFPRLDATPARPGGSCRMGKGSICHHLCKTVAFLYLLPRHMWQSRVENERYSVSYIDRVSALET